MRIRTVLDSVECTHCSITRLCHFSATKQTKQQPDVILAPVPNRAPQLSHIALNHNALLISSSF